MVYEYEYMEELEGVTFPDFAKYNNKLVIHGAGINGVLCAYALKKRGIDFLCFSDNDPLKQGTEFLGYKVYSPQKSSELYPEAAVLLDVYCRGDIVEQLHSVGFDTILYPAGLFIGLDCDDAAKYLSGLADAEGKGYLFRETLDAEQVFEWIEEYMIRGVTYVTGKRDISRSVNLDITDRCSLRCKNCLAFKAYYKKPEHTPWAELEKVIDKLSEMHWFRRYHLLGGEPLLYPDLDKLLNKLVTIPEVGHINIITNGTIVPGEAALEAMKNKKVMLRISYYGDLSRNYQKLVDVCKQKGINVRVHAQRWKEIGSVLERKSNEEETKARYMECSQREGSFFYVMHGKATLCPFAANNRVLGLFEEVSDDFVDIMETPTERLKGSFENLYTKKEPLTACKYCNGWLPYATKEIPVAEQCPNGVSPEFPKYD